MKARSICNVAQQRVSLTVITYKTELLEDHEVTKSETNPLAPSSSGPIVYNNGTTRVCKTGELTRYYGIAFSNALSFFELSGSDEEKIQNLRDQFANSEARVQLGL